MKRLIAIDTDDAGNVTISGIACPIEWERVQRAETDADEMVATAVPAAVLTERDNSYGIYIGAIFGGRLCVTGWSAYTVPHVAATGFRVDAVDTVTGEPLRWSLRVKLPGNDPVKNETEARCRLSYRLNHEAQRRTDLTESVAATLSEDA